MNKLLEFGIFAALVAATYVAFVEFKPLAAWAFASIVWAVYFASIIDFDDSGSS